VNAPQRDLAEKLQALPIKDGQPDVAALGDPALIGKEWATELHLTREEQLQQLVDYLEKVQAGAEMPAAPG
jgi:hypothetical protein